MGDFLVEGTLAQLNLARSLAGKQHGFVFAVGEVKTFPPIP
jgi:hypothetical protein